MDYGKDGTSASGMEMVVLAVLLVVCAVVAWRLYQRFSGHEVSDVNGLRMSRRPPASPP